MTKQEEIDRFKAIAEAQPKDSYLYSIMRSIVGEVEWAIRNDFGFVEFTERIQVMDDYRKEKGKFQKEIKELELTRSKLADEIGRMSRAIQDLKEQMVQVRAEALLLYQRVAASTVGA